MQFQPILGPIWASLTPYTSQKLWAILLCFGLFVHPKMGPKWVHDWSRMIFSKSDLGPPKVPNHVLVAHFWGLLCLWVSNHLPGPFGDLKYMFLPFFVAVLTPQQNGCNGPNVHRRVPQTVWLGQWDKGHLRIHVRWTTNSPVYRSMKPNFLQNSPKRTRTGPNNTNNFHFFSLVPIPSLD